MGSNYKGGISMDALGFNDPGNTDLLLTRFGQALGAARTKVKATGVVRFAIIVDDAQSRPLMNPDGTVAIEGDPGVWSWERVVDAEAKHTGTDPFQEGTNDTE